MMETETKNIPVCPYHEDPVPLLWTFKFTSFEYWCPACGYKCGMLDYESTAPLTEELGLAKQQWEEKAKAFLSGDADEGEWEYAVKPLKEEHSPAHFLPAIKSTHVGCLCCPGVEEHLCLKTKLHSDGWMITRNNDLYFKESMETEWEDCKTLAFIEAFAAADPEADWRAINYTPLHGETYQRQNGKWVLVEQNEGYA